MSKGEKMTKVTVDHFWLFLAAVLIFTANADSGKDLIDALVYYFMKG